MDVLGFPFWIEYSQTNESFLHSVALKSSESAKKGLEKAAASPSTGSRQHRRKNAVGNAEDLVSQFISIESPPPQPPSPITVNVNNDSPSPEPEPAFSGSGSISYSEFASSSEQAESAEKISQKKLTKQEFTIGGLPADNYHEWAGTVQDRPMPIKYE